jgi:hypothetical protein
MKNALLDRGAGRVQRVLDARLLLTHLGLGGRADLEHRDAAGELGQALLRLLEVVVADGLLDLLAELGDPGLDGLLRAAAVDDRGVVLVHQDLRGAAEVDVVFELRSPARRLRVRLPGSGEQSADAQPSRDELVHLREWLRAAFECRPSWRCTKERT